MRIWPFCRHREVSLIHLSQKAGTNDPTQLNQKCHQLLSQATVSYNSKSNILTVWNVEFIGCLQNLSHLWPKSGWKASLSLNYLAFLVHMHSSTPWTRAKVWTRTHACTNNQFQSVENRIVCYSSINIKHQWLESFHPHFSIILFLLYKLEFFILFF